MKNVRQSLEWGKEVCIRKSLSSKIKRHRSWTSKSFKLGLLVIPFSHKWYKEGTVGERFSKKEKWYKNIIKMTPYKVCLIVVT